LHITTTPFSGLLILKPRRYSDNRGFFSETFNRCRLQRAGIDVEFVQDNLSFSKAVHTLRGLHFQSGNSAQAKLVSVVKGSALDVAVDLRRSSPCFGQHLKLKLSASEGNQLLVPVGFAHGFLTLEPETFFTYKVSNYYSPAHDAGIRFNDGLLDIEWGVAPEAIVTSSKDADLPSFDPTVEYFP
jgi:dTDP-4-dehydrorhamnose 3,5-epimerase